ncbi:hypothetical protein [Sphingopyxis sp. YF1]|uniref:hypothetical protein n=1 Tax=Sphingopyxis sp. YF1 TaxID=2482763 RepID=UPI001F60088B|nr:hypothetical protein [Sphingopyxis sp. YF1]
MSEAERLGLLLIVVAAMLAFSVRALWGSSEPKPSAKNGWRKAPPKTSGGGFDDQHWGEGD